MQCSGVALGENGATRVTTLRPRAFYKFFKCRGSDRKMAKQSTGSPTTTVRPPKTRTTGNRGRRGGCEDETPPNPQCTSRNGRAGFQERPEGCIGNTEAIEDPSGRTVPCEDDLRKVVRELDAIVISVERTGNRHRSPSQTAIRTKPYMFVSFSFISFYYAVNTALDA